MKDVYPMREATLVDLEVLVSHRRKMFEDIAQAKGGEVDPALLDRMDEAYRVFIQEHMPDGSLHAWVILDGKRIVASGAISIIRQSPPHYAYTGGDLPLLHSVYTLPGYRRKGLARKVVLQTIDFCREQGYPLMTLHASAEGRPLYEALGFKLTHEMRLNFP